MKIITSCAQCHSEFGIPRFSTTELVQVPDSGVIIATCDLGHETIQVIQNERYQLLGDMAIDSIARDNFQGAIGLFASSIERLYEYYIRMICRYRGIEEESIKTSFKPIANMSERQIGAFVLAYLIENKTSASLLPQSAVNLRNRVIHKGQIASKSDAIAFGQAVANCAFPILNMLGRNELFDTITKATFDLLKTRRQEATKQELHTSTMALNCILRPNKDASPVSIENAVKQFEEGPDFAKAVRESREFGRTVDPKSRVKIR